MRPILSILTPAIWDRLEAVQLLRTHIEQQNVPRRPIIEHLVLFDDRTRSVGAKRQALLDSARGYYIAFCDDDDWVSDDYVTSILAAALNSPDVITFHQRAIHNAEECEIIFDARCTEDGAWNPGATARRPPWHVCAWRREIVEECLFPDSSYGEDLQWSLQARLRMRTHFHIPKVLHTYRHSAETTAAPAPAH